jgi:hypothetical protein
VTVLVATNGRTRFKDAQTAATLLGVADVEIAVALLVPERHTRFSAVPSARQIPATPASDGPATTPAGGRPRPAA